jgi:poly(3-hydroxybutyrate) depolymerase
MVKRAARPLAVAGSLLLAAASPVHGADVSKETVTSRNKARVYYLYAPASVPPDRPAPLIVTIHGSTSSGRRLVDAWKDLAEKEGIVLAGPDSTDAVHWASPQDGPLLLRDVVDAVGAKRAIDPRRVYLFGHSAGAVFALQMACLESEYFTAAAVHAGAVDPQYFSIFDFAARKIPIAIWIGTRDEFFPIDGVRATAKALEARGFPVTLTEIPDHNHNYSAVSKDLNVRIWAFLSDQKLPGDPKYRVYADPH